ncbi:M23 family metallopeptidase [bacterium SCSIO 12741]|nr:M23 family metallopeptidase [bacterium SCSIO 12741]
MKEKKYRYNRTTLSYERIQLTARDRLVRLTTYAFTGVVFASIFVLLTYFFIDSPKEKQLKRENAQLRLQYDLLDKDMDLVENVLADLERRDDDIWRVVLEAEPIPDNIRKAGFGGVNRHQHLEGYENSKLVIDAHKRMDQLKKELYIQSKSYDEVMDMAQKKEDMLASIPSIIPISNDDLKRVSSGFGMRIHPRLKILKMHPGQDFAANVGTEIYVTGNGKVVKIKNVRNGYGKHIVVDHGYGYQSLYAHLSEFKVKLGQKVKRGEVIGLSGNTGTSTGPHLHYEVIHNGKKINPVNFYYQDLTPQQYEEIIELSQMPLQSFD